MTSGVDDLAQRVRLLILRGMLQITAILLQDNFMATIAGGAVTADGKPVWLVDVEMMGRAFHTCDSSSTRSA